MKDSPILTRRDFLAAAGIAAAAGILRPALSYGEDPKPAVAFTLPALPYPVDALEPAIDKETMTIHHDQNALYRSLHFGIRSGRGGCSPRSAIHSTP